MGIVLDCTKFARSKNVVQLNSDLNLINSPKCNISERRLGDSKKPTINFKWSRFQNYMLQETQDFTKDYVLSPMCIQSVQAAFKPIRDDYLYYAIKFQPSLLDAMAHFPKIFKKGSESSKELPLTNVIRFKIYQHSIEMLRFMAYIQDLVKHGDTEEAKSVVEMLAFSHILMGISISDFRLFNMALVIFIKKFLTLDDSSDLVSFVTTITRWVCNSIQIRCSHTIQIQEFISGDSSNKVIARNNLRTSKKWSELVKLLRDDLKDDIELLLSCITEENSRDDFGLDPVNKVLVDCFSSNKRRPLCNNRI